MVVKIDYFKLEWWLKKAEWWLGLTTPDQCGQNPVIYIRTLGLLMTTLSSKEVIKHYDYGDEGDRV